MLHHRRNDERFAAAHAEVDALLQRLSRDVTTLEDGDNPANRQALADAGERYETAEAQLGHAQSVSELLVVRQIAVEGLESTRAVRTRLGLDPGPEPAPAPQASAPETEHHSWAEMLQSRGGLGTAIGAGAAGGLLGLLGGAVLGEAIGDGGDWGGGDGGYGGDTF